MFKKVPEHKVYCGHCHLRITIAQRGEMVIAGIWDQRTPFHGPCLEERAKAGERHIRKML